MELSNAEVFLLLWAGIFTISTAYLAHQVRQANESKLVMLRTLIGVALGKVIAEVKEGRIQFRDAEESKTD